MRSNPFITMLTVAVGLAAAGAGAQLPPKTAMGIALLSQDNRIEVAQVRPGGPGEAMGIKPGDIITHAGGRKVRNMTRMTAFIQGLDVGDPVELTVSRKGQVLVLKGTAMARP